MFFFFYWPILKCALLNFLSQEKEKWFKNIEEGKLQEMQNIYQELRTKGLERSVKKWKPKSESFEGNTALTSATVYGHLHICKWLVRENLVDVNLKDDDGGNVLHHAVRQDRPEIRSPQTLLSSDSVTSGSRNDGGHGRWSKHGAKTLANIIPRGPCPVYDGTRAKPGLF